MRNTNEYKFDVLIVGGGPAGIAAACAAADWARVAIVDENPALGGQIWRNAFLAKGGNAARMWRRKLQNTTVTLLHGLRVFDAPAPGVLHAESPDGLRVLRYEKLILTTGARERFLPFPGWTLRNVIGAGGLQAMVKSGLPVEGKRVVVAGSGPLLFAVAAYLQRHRAKVLCVCEQAPLSQLAQFSSALATHPDKLVQALHYRWQLRGTPYRFGWWPATAHGESQVESVTITDGKREQTLACDFLACGFHLVPNAELPALLGCRLHLGVVAVDSMQQTSIPNVLCAGELTRIGGLEKSLVEGAVAGYVGAGQQAPARRLFRKRDKALRLAAAMDRAFSLRPELRQVPTGDTLVCRCEDVSYECLRHHNSWRSAKLHTRCGMGPCQGRVCGAATDFLFGWPADSLRPPTSPVRVATLIATDRAPEQS